MIDFDEYIRHGEPDKKEKASAWKTAILFYSIFFHS